MSFNNDMYPFSIYVECIYDSACIRFNLFYSVMPWCFVMLSLLYVAGPHVKQPLADELSWVNIFW